MRANDSEAMGWWMVARAGRSAASAAAAALRLDAGAIFEDVAGLTVEVLAEGARRSWTTAHAVIETPVFMPVGTRGSVRTHGAVVSSANCMGAHATRPCAGGVLAGDGA